MNFQKYSTERTGLVVWTNIVAEGGNLEPCTVLIGSVPGYWFLIVHKLEGKNKNQCTRQK